MQTNETKGIKMLTIKILAIFAAAAKVTVLAAVTCGTGLAVVPGVVAYLAAKEAVAVNG